MNTPTALEPDSFTTYEKQAELRRVIDSKYFAKAPRRKLFLEFISERALRGEGDKLNEYLIGIEVYEKGTDFDPQQDPIVRVQAHEIRRALKSYYEAEGKQSPIRVELPLGQYAPLFTRNKTEVCRSPVPAVSQGASAGAAERKPVWRLAVPIVGLSLACGLFGLLFLREHAFARRAATVTPLPEVEEWFWKPFLSPGSQPLILVSSSPALSLATKQQSEQVLKEAYEIPKGKLLAFQDTPHFHEMKSFAFVPSTADYTGIGEALGLVSLLRLMSGQAATIRVKPSRLADYTEIQANNTILLGGSNQWTNRALSEPREFSSSLSEGAITNTHPRPGEQPVYVPKFDPVTGDLVRDFALIVMLPNHGQEKRLLRLDGVYTQGTEAAAEYVTTAEGLLELRKALIAASPDRKTLPNFFEALLSVPVENHVPGGASLVAVRIVPDAD